MTIGLIRQVHLNEHKRSALEWIGTENMKETINLMLKESPKDNNVANILTYMLEKNNTKNIHNNFFGMLNKRDMFTFFEEEINFNNNTIDDCKVIWPRVTTINY